MSRQMHQSYDEITGNIDTCDNKDQCTLSRAKDISQAIYVIYLEIDT